MLLMPPRHGKTRLASQSFPAYFLGHRPDAQIIAASATSALAEDWGRDVRNTIASQEYKNLFPRITLADDSQAKGKWHTNQGGIYYAIGVGGAIMGRGAHLALVDDAFASYEDMQSDAELNAVWEWFTGSLYNRLMPGGVIIVIGHRGNARDLQGRLLDQQAAGGDKYRVVEFPAIDDDGNALWPDRYPIEVLNRVRAVDPRKFDALYMQRPTAAGAGLLKAEWWRPWPAQIEKPQLVYVMQVWDTAFEAKETSDYSACTTWGVFFSEQNNRHELFLLGRYRKRVDFPALRREAKAYYDAYNRSQIGPVDRVIIEPKATGKPIVAELRRAGVPIFEFATMRNSRSEMSKPARVQAASVVLESGSVWYPEGAIWAHDVISECAAFSPMMTHEFDDLTDSCVMAWTYLRRTWWVSDGADEDPITGPLPVLRRATARTDDDVYDDDERDEFAVAPKIRVIGRG